MLAVCKRLMEKLMDYLPTHIAATLDSTTPGFLRHTVFQKHWYGILPVFIKIQRDIDQHHRECRATNQPIRVGNFQVVLYLRAINNGRVSKWHAWRKTWQASFDGCWRNRIFTNQKFWRCREQPLKCVWNRTFLQPGIFWSKEFV